jgi:hypothetical protein
MHPMRLATALALAAMLTTGAPEADAAQKFPPLTQARSCSAVRNAVADLVADQAFQRRYRRHRRHHWRRRPMPSALRGGRAKARTSAPAKAAGDARATGESSSRGPSHFTRTNNQVDGVSEADRVKTDGRYLYTIAGRDVLILKSWPASATSVVARYRAGKRERPHTLMLRGDKLVLLSRHNVRRTRRGKSGRSYRRYTQGMRLTVLDIRDRRQPKALAHVDLDGKLLAARRIGKQLVLVSAGSVFVPPSVWSELRRPVRVQSGPKRHYFYGQGQTHRPAPQTQRAPTYAELRQRARQALGKLPMKVLLPTATFLSAQGAALATRSMHRCQDVYLPRNGASMGLLSVTSLNLDGGPVRSTAVLANGYKVYASKRAVYVAGTSVRSVSWRRRRWPTFRGTVVHKFSLAGGPRYAASGGVPGYLLNQFSMDEHRGYLRVATTQRGWGWRGGQRFRGGNGLFVLGQRGRRLTVVGSVTGLAPGERIYSARLLGDQGYIVTFRRTDPLYTLDLRNPRRPRLMGELKINGYSSYIHPLAGGRLLTIGQDATSRGRVRGAHLQIFDVRNLRKPTRTHHLLLTPNGRSSSRAQYDHHAFTYDAKNGMLAVPLRSYSSGQRFTGIALVRVSPRKGFSALGTVDHTDIGVPAATIGWRCPPNARCALNTPRPTRRRWVPIHRTVFIDRYMYTLSDIGVKVHDVGKTQPRRLVALHLAAK